MNTRFLIRNRFIAVLIVIVLVVVSCKTNRPISRDTSWTILFYNVENLFDTTDDPNTSDEDFTPSGKLQWTSERLETKLERIGEVVAKGSPSLPALIGMCEVENRAVLEMLVASNRLVAADYQIVHRDSPDERGIDVALLYRPDQFQVSEQEWIEVKLSKEGDPNTRDILYVKGKLGGEEVHVFVNHWPSRGGGEDVTDVFRREAAQKLSDKITAIQSANSSAKIICMGDFNDYPSNGSQREVLKSGIDKTSVLCNLMADDELRGEGSYWYKGSWGPLDQFIVSWSLLDSTKGLGTSMESATTYREDYLMFTDNQNQQRPNRTYAGEKYVNGYSDHLPIFLQLQRR